MVASFRMLKTPILKMTIGLFVQLWQAIHRRLCRTLYCMTRELSSSSLYKNISIHILFHIFLNFAANYSKLYQLNPAQYYLRTYGLFVGQAWLFVFIIVSSVGNSLAIAIEVDYIELLTLDYKLPLSNEINSAIIQNHRHVIG